MFALGAFFYIQDHDPETAESLGWLPLTSLIIYIAAFGIGAGPIPFMMFTEILPAKVTIRITHNKIHFNFFDKFLDDFEYR